MWKSDDESRESVLEGIAYSANFIVFLHAVHEPESVQAGPDDPHLLAVPNEVFGGAGEPEPESVQAEPDDHLLAVLIEVFGDGQTAVKYYRLLHDKHGLASCDLAYCDDQLLIEAGLDKRFHRIKLLKSIAKSAGERSDSARSLSSVEPEVSRQIRCCH